MIKSFSELASPPGTLLKSSESFTIGFTYFTAGFAVSVLHVTDGASPVLVMVAAFLVNSATSTLAFAAVVGGGGSAAAGVLSGWLVATRFGLFAAAIGPRLWPERWKRALGAHLAFDPPVALAQREPTDDGLRRVFVTSGLWLVIPWWTAAVLGSLVGDRLPDAEALGLDVLLPAMLLAIVWPQLKSGWLVAVAAAVIALALVEVTPGGVPVLLAALAALLRLREPTGATEPGDDPAPC